MTRVLFFCFALILASTPALADDKQRARELHERGLRYYKVGQHAEAIRYYRQAYQAYPVPGILFNLAQAYRQNGDCALAVQTYKQYVAEVPSGANADIARGHMKSLACEPEAEPQPPQLQPSKSTPDSAPAPAAITGAAPPADRGGPMRLAGLIALGVAAAAGTGSIVYGLKARSTSSEVNAFFAEGGTWSEELADLEARGERQEKASVIFAITAGSAAVAGSILYLAGRGVFGGTETKVGAGPVQGGLVLTTAARF